MTAKHIYNLLFLSWIAAICLGDGQTNAPASAPAAESTSSDEWSLDEGMEDIELLDLEVAEVTVFTAARREQKINEVPYAVSVITAEDIRWSGARSIPDALRLAVGMDVSQLSYSNSAFTPRGYHSLLANQILVLIDGRQIFDPVFAATFMGAHPIMLEDIERIEVIRGPGGVSWGANAAQGVINIITKDPRNQQGLTLRGLGGSRGMHKIYTGYGAGDEKLRMRFSAEYEASDGFYDPRVIYRTLDDEYHAEKFSFHSVYDKTARDQIIVSAGSGNMQDGFSPSPITGFGLRVQPGMRSSFLMGAWNHEIAGKNTFELRGYVSEVYGRMGIKQYETQYQQLGLLFNHQFDFAEDHTFAWGVDNRVDFIDGSLADPFMLRDDHITSNTIGLFAEYEWRFAPKWRFGLGGRIEYDNYGGFAPSARGSLSYQLNRQTLLYAAISRAFAMPPVGTRFMNGILLNGITRQTAPQDIDTITLMAYELGWRGQYFDERLDWNFNFFWHETADLVTISTALGPPGILQARMDNRGDSSIYGVELESEFKATEKLTLLGNYTFQMLNWRSQVLYTDTDYMQPPKHKFMLGARYKATEDLRLSSHLYYVDASRGPNPWFPLVPQGIDPYFRLDLRAEQEFWDDRAALAVGVRNLLDKSHFEGTSAFLDEAEVPRMVYAELRVVFNE